MLTRRKALLGLAATVSVATAVSAHPFTHPVEIFGQLQYNDWQQHQLSFHAGAFAMVDVMPQRGPIQVHVYDAYWNHITSSEVTSNTAMVSWMVHQGGPYVIEVENRSSGWQNYILQAREMFD